MNLTKLDKKTNKGSELPRDSKYTVNKSIHIAQALMQASGTHSVHVTPALTKTYESHIAEAGNKQISRSVTFLSQQGVGKRTNQNQLQGHAEHR